MPTQPQPFVPWLSVATQALQGRQKRQDVDYERNQEERAYNDQQALRQQQMATQADATQYARAQDRRRNGRQDNLDLADAYDRGFIPQEQAQSQGRRVGDAPQQAQSFDTTGVGLGQQAAGNAVQQAPSVYSIAGKALVKGRNSVAEQAAVVAQQNRAAEQQEARRYREQDLAAATTQRAADQAFQAGENAKNRAVQMRGQGLRPQAGDGLTPRQQMPTEGERKASAFYISGRQGYDTMESLLNGTDGKAKAVPSWLGQQAAKVGMGAGNVLTNDQTRQLRQAANQMADAWLRYTSGAAVPESEVQRFGESFVPAPGDDPATLKQKADARRTIMQALEAGAGRALQSTGENPLGRPGATAQPNTATRPPLGSFQR